MGLDLMRELFNKTDGAAGRLSTLHHQVGREVGGGLRQDRYYGPRTA